MVTRKVKVLSLPETIKEKSTFRAKGLRRELVVHSRRRAFARNVDFCFIVSGSERTFTFRISLNTLPTLATLVRDNRGLKQATFLSTRTSAGSKSRRYRWRIVASAVLV